MYNFNLKKEYFFLSLILLLSFILNIYGLNWGLPSCWNTDQSVATALDMLKDKTFLPQDYLHPSLYYYILIIFIAPYLLFQSVFYANFDSFLSASKVSWNYMALNHPDLATGIFISARLSSVIFSLLTVFFVYRAAYALHSRRAGLFSALILALTMDFVHWAHMEKSVALVDLLMLLAVYYAALIFKQGYSRKNFFLSCLFGGLALSAKFNGALVFLLIPVISLRKNTKNIESFFKTLFYGVAVYALAFIVTSPGILLKANKYYAESTGEYGSKFMPGNFADLANTWLANIISICETLMQMFGILLFILAGCGLIYGIFKYCRKLHPLFIVACVPLFTICLFAFSPRISLSANSKFIIQVVPFMAVLGGVFSDDFLNGKVFSGLKINFKAVFLWVIFIASFFYCLSLDAILTHGDIRYLANKWLAENIPVKSNIIVNNQLEYSLGVEVLKDYNVYVLGGGAGTKGAYSFIKGKYANIVPCDIPQLDSLSPAYVVSPCWQLKRSLVCSRLDTLSGKFVLLRSFERRQPWYWNPSIGGYEPSKIEIYAKSSKR